MISRFTKEKIIESSRIEDVVSDFVKLKKRGSNLIGLCPFHNEKTPSFNVSPARNIFKCFGCGKGGDSITFLMEHEKITYPEALRMLANKYQIEIEEEVLSEEEQKKKQQEQSETESLLVVSSYAQKYFSDTLIQHPEGKAIGMTYFKERGFSEETIRKFQLGYSPEEKNAFSKSAVDAGYKVKFLVATGLSFLPENYSAEDESSQDKLIDRFRGRVMFPIHNLTGRVIGFGGRTLSSEKKTAKYVNSPDSEIYHKSKVLYGIYFAKNEIVSKDNCLLVEGYTDVISLHQSGIQNVVASSGTSLTTEQIRLVARYTKNITILYDGDAAGIKASLRGIDMILEEGLNVRIVLFPDGEDPDSFARKKSQWEVQEFIAKNSTDFILYKAELLLNDAGNDPVKKAALIRNIMESIARISDPIVRSEYTKLLSVKMSITEQVLISELNKTRSNLFKKTTPTEDLEELLPETLPAPQTMDDFSSYHQERDIVRLILQYGNLEIAEEHLDTENSNSTPVFIKVADYILHELEIDSIEPDDANFKDFLFEIKNNKDSFSTSDLETENKQNPFEKYFVSHANPELSAMAIDLLTAQYELSENWKTTHHIHVPVERDVLKNAVVSAVLALKLKKVQGMIDLVSDQIKNSLDETEQENLMRKKMDYDKLKSQIGKLKGTVVIR